MSPGASASQVSSSHSEEKSSSSSSSSSFSEQSSSSVSHGANLASVAAGQVAATVLAQDVIAH